MPGQIRDVQVPTIGSPLGPCGTWSGDRSGADSHSRTAELEICGSSEGDSAVHTKYRSEYFATHQLLGIKAGKLWEFQVAVGHFK